MDDDTTRAAEGIFVAVVLGAALWLLVYIWIVG
jgi:hypothetical protein